MKSNDVLEKYVIKKIVEAMRSLSEKVYCTCGEKLEVVDSTVICPAYARDKSHSAIYLKRKHNVKAWGTCEDITRYNTLSEIFDLIVNALDREDNYIDEAPQR